jgi:hypothetical protein
MKYPAALVYFEVRTESCRLQQDVDWCDGVATAAIEKSREAKRRRQGEYRQEIGAWVITYWLNIPRTIVLERPE